MPTAALIGTRNEGVAPHRIPHAWRDSLLASLAGYGTTSLLLYYGMSWLGVLHPSQPQLDPRMVAIIDLIDSAFGWGVLLVPVAFSYRLEWRRSRAVSLCVLASFIGCLLTGLETWILFVDPRYRVPSGIYVAAGMLNALLAACVLLFLRRRSARHNGIGS